MTQIICLPRTLRRNPIDLAALDSDSGMRPEHLEPPDCIRGAADMFGGHRRERSISRRDF